MDKSDVCLARTFSAFESIHSDKRDSYEELHGISVSILMYKQRRVIVR